MKVIKIINLRSSINTDEHLLDVEKDAFLADLSSRLNVIFTDHKSAHLTIFLVETGGTEEAFAKIYKSYRPPYYLLTTNRRNSLPAALEIGAFLDQKKLPYKIMHGDMKQLSNEFAKIDAENPRYEISNIRLGVIGKPSPWLIASNLSRERAKGKFGITIVDIPYESFIKEIDKKSYPSGERVEKISKTLANNPYLPGALHIYGAIKRLIDKHDLHGFSIRCFDLLDTYRNTACLALSLLNEEGISAGCEGDLPVLIGMHLARNILSVDAFQANPSSVDIDRGLAIFAHCTIPFSMCAKIDFMTHFESGLGIGLRGEMKLGPCTIFRLSNDLKKVYLAEGEILENTTRDDLCRTQIIVHLDEGVDQLLSSPLGNHQLIIYGHHKKALLNVLRLIDENIELV